MKKKRVLIVVNYFYPYVSGVSEYTRNLARELSKQYDVTVLTGKHRADLPQMEDFEGYTIIRSEPLFFLDKGYVSFDFIRKFRALSSQVDIVNLHLPMLECGLFGILTNKPLIVTYQCDLAIVGSLLSRIAVVCVRLSMRFALKRSDTIVVLSQDYASESKLLEGLEAKIVEVAPPNRFEKMPYSLTKTTNDRPLICGFVGRFVREKGIETIIQAAKVLRGEGFHFWLAGDYEGVAGGSIYNEIKNDIASLGENIRLLGKLSDEELINFYKEIDILLLPSTNRYEAFGMVQLEAMTFGAIPVTSNMPGVREAILKTAIGQLCEPASSTSLIDAIRRAQGERRRASRDDVRGLVLRKFSNIKFEETYVAIVEKLLTKV
ncbi:glycosyltransferase family 4 protein [Marivivens sp. JLT3646]|uniref:glycosyltransferase family 4 protein n=1 Tax=Marivivens sp. JLT3646 TaxID=1920883 RepID=UPI0007FE06F8|nr:glycosyltransferase family 4 protein [Marivivens sp. JLT3646]APO88552.1 hypothetical protein BSK21_15520 [Marivivens sp. JLT3646]OBR39256.1 hypothetical protein A9199_12355 [Donghicola sp. JL3646]